VECSLIPGRLGPKPFASRCGLIRGEVFVYIRMKSLKVIWALVAVTYAFAGEGARATNSILPKQFGGWQAAGAIQTSKDPLVADPVNTALLKEYGFTDLESATYTRDGGRKLTLKAARFGDASGA